MPRPRERKILLPGQSKFLSMEEEKIAIENKMKEIEEVAKKVQQMRTLSTKNMEGLRTLPYNLFIFCL